MRGEKFSASARCLFSNKLLEKTYSLSKYYSTANIVITALSASSSLHNQAIFTAVINDKGRWENTGKVANHEPQRFLHSFFKCFSDISRGYYLGKPVESAD